MNINYKLIFGTIPFSCLYVQSGNCKNIESKHPNVIIVLTDDQGKGDLKCLGNPVIKTPNIDNFYSDAVRLTNFHVSPTSAPTRAALMTGRFTDRTNCFHTIGARDRVYLEEKLMPQVFAENGYKTAMFGKWHLGDNYPYRPQDRGFQEVITFFGGGVGQEPDYWGNDYFDDTYQHNGKEQKYEGYCTDIWFDEAIKYIEKNKDNPFFCYLSLNAPHGPYNVSKKYSDLYKDTKYNQSAKNFMGMVTCIDDNFKKLEDKLNELGISDNTILIFMTDNGTVGGYSVYDGGLRGMKCSEYEGGHCVPFFIKWEKGKLNGGRDINDLTAHVDLLPTFIDLCNLKFKSQNKLDGTSLSPLFYNKSNNINNRTIVTDSQRLLDLVKWRKSSLMTKDWRLINGKELYNIKKDPKQKNDVSSQHPDIVNKLRGEYDNWWSSLNADEINTKYAYYWVGSDKENPVKLTAHDMICSDLKNGWKQSGVLQMQTGKGRHKIRVVKEGYYNITLCHYPKESGYAINQKVQSSQPKEGVMDVLPSSNDIKLTKAYLTLADLENEKPCMKSINEGDKGVTYNVFLNKGYYDLDGYFEDELERFFPAYYIYVERL